MDPATVLAAIGLAQQLIAWAQQIGTALHQNGNMTDEQFAQMQAQIQAMLAGPQWLTDAQRAAGMTAPPPVAFATTPTPPAPAQPVAPAVQPTPAPAASATPTVQQGAEHFTFTEPLK